MNKKTLSTAFLSVLLFSATLGMLFMAPVKAQPQEILVPDQYNKIQWAIGNATAGDTILVRAGTHYEHVTIDKSLTLIGENRRTTIIDGGGQKQTIVSITASKVEIRGFTIKNGSAHLPWCGVFIGRSENVTVYNVVIKENYHGILLCQSNSSNILNNEITSNYALGVQFSDSNNNQIVGNTIADNPIGAYVSSNTSSLNVFYHNNFINNTHQVTCFGPTKWDNGKDGNYWSDYTGVDTNGDGIGDTKTPHLGMDKYPLMSLWAPILGDVNFDGIVDISDVILVALAFASAAVDDPTTPSDETRKWNPDADLNGDGLIDIVDLVIIGGNFGKTW